MRQHNYWLQETAILWLKWLLFNLMTLWNQFTVYVYRYSHGKNLRNQSSFAFTQNFCTELLTVLKKNKKCIKIGGGNQAHSIIYSSLNNKYLLHISIVMFKYKYGLLVFEICQHGMFLLYWPVCPILIFCKLKQYFHLGFGRNVSIYLHIYK